MKLRAMAAAILFTVIGPAGARADTVLDILGVEKSVNDASRRAQETGDAIAKAFADQALKLIEEWKKANKELINTGFDRLDQQTRRIFTDINNIATRIEKGEAVAFIDLQRTMVNAGSIVDALSPLGSKEPVVVFYWPAVVIPGGEKIVNVHILGMRIANANPRMTMAGADVKVKKHTDNDISFDFDSTKLKTAEDATTTTDFVLKYDADASSVFKPSTWWADGTRQRNIDVKVLPTVPGTVSLIQTVRKEDWDRRMIGPFTVGGVGQDAPYPTGYDLTPEDRDAGWIVDYEAQKNAHFDDNGGDGDGGSSCTGYDPHNFSRTHVAFVLQHGHKTDWKGHKSDAHQNCRIWVHLKHQKFVETKLPAETKALSWNADTDFQFVRDISSYEIAMKLYNGITYTIRSEAQIPYSLFEILKDDTSLKFRPRQPRGF